MDNDEVGEVMDVRGEDELRQSVRRGEDRIGHGKYGPGAIEEVSLPVDEEREARERDIEDPADRARDPDVLRDGGPTRNRGVSTTTGRARKGAPTASGDRAEERPHRPH